MAAPNLSIIGLNIIHIIDNVIVIGCENVNFARRTKCNKCGLEKAGGGPASAASVGSVGIIGNYNYSSDVLIFV
jgi:hypothetical protein